MCLAHTFNNSDWGVSINCLISCIHTWSAQNCHHRDICQYITVSTRFTSLPIYTYHDITAPRSVQYHVQELKEVLVKNSHVHVECRNFSYSGNAVAGLHTMCFISNLWLPKLQHFSEGCIPPNFTRWLPCSQWLTVIANYFINSHPNLRL